VIVYTGRELTREEEVELAAYSESIIIKGVRSQERLFDEASLFLHRMVEKMPEKKRTMIANLHDANRMLSDKKVLIVDDDMRNLFALSNSLSAKGIQTIKVQDGRKALDELEKTPGIELVLMDIMMPGMDGYETMSRIRQQKRFAKLPIIALTAKAMKADRQKCIESGANDYLSKPIDVDRLLSMMRVWMYR
jgi:CheY-like chemotaxis protein